MMYAILSVEREVIIMFEYQVTLLCKSGKYRPVSAIVRRQNAVDLNDKAQKKSVVNDGIIKICNARGWVIRDLQRYEYLKSKVREYDKKKIEQENKERYERIKEQHYQDGTWKRPKKKD